MTPSFRGARHVTVAVSWRLLLSSEITENVTPLGFGDVGTGVGFAIAAGVVGIGVGSGDAAATGVGSAEAGGFERMAGEGDGFAPGEAQPATRTASAAAATNLRVVGSLIFDTAP